MAQRNDQSPDLRMILPAEEPMRKSTSLTSSGIGGGVGGNPLKRSGSSLTKLKNKYSTLFIEKCFEQNISPTPEILEMIQSSNNEEILKLDIPKDPQPAEVALICQIFMDFPKPFAIKLIETELDEKALHMMANLISVS
jgi:hypothetical protein